MGVIKYRINNISTDWETLKFPGGTISISLIKKKLQQLPFIEFEKSPIDFQIIEKESQKIFEDPNEELENGSFVIVQRSFPENPSLNEENNAQTSEPLSISTKIGIETSSAEQTISRIPAGYTCYKCRQPGHLMKDCPANAFSSRKRNEAYLDKSQEISKLGELSKTKVLKTRKFALLFSSPKNILEELDKNSLSALKVLPRFLDEESNRSESSKIESKEEEGNKGESKLNNTVQNNNPSKFELLCPICRKFFNVATYTSCCMFSFCFGCIDRHLAKFKECFICKTTASKCNLKTNIAIRNYLNNQKLNELNISKFDYFKPPKRILQDSEFLVKSVKVPKEMQPYVRPNIFTDGGYDESKSNFSLKDEDDKKRVKYSEPKGRGVESNKYDNYDKYDDYEGDKYDKYNDHKYTKYNDYKDRYNDYKDRYNDYDRKENYKNFDSHDKYGSFRKFGRYDDYGKSRRENRKYDDYHTYDRKYYRKDRRYK